MFSIDIPPTDLACPQQKPCNERASHKRGLPETDLSKSAIIDETSFPNFSIREYVLSSRDKHIKANWPFSPKTLQLCLKYGVKDLLPPFQSLHTVRTLSIGGCSVENATPKNRSISSFDGKPAQLDHHGMLNSFKFAKSNEKRGKTCIDSTTTSLSPSEINSIPTFLSSSSPVEFNTLSKASRKAEAAEKTAKPATKKFRFSVKNGVRAYQVSGEDIISNCTTISETMASKTCPVCKTFSSPSNTTLNAHIDRCLSAESTPKCSLHSKSTKHRFKPRKTKLLVDIYATASLCTLEDLDRRNGTTWAIVSSRLPTRDVEKSDMHYEGKRNRTTLVHPKVSNEDGVYIDSKGTKLRILSAFNDVSCSKVRENLGSTRTKKEDEGKKFHSFKRKRFGKLAVQRKNISPLKDLTTQIDKAHERHNEVEEGCKMDRHQLNPSKPHDSGCLRQWICSKRTGVAKKVTRKEGQKNFNLLVQSDMNKEKNSDRKHTNSLENPIFSPKDINMTEMDCPLYGNKILDNTGRSSGSKNAGSPRLFVELLRDVNALKKGNTFSGDRYLVEASNPNGHCTASSSERRSNVVNGDSSDTSSKDYHATVLEDTKLYSLSEKMASFSKPSSITGSKSPLLKKHSALKSVDRRCGLLDENTESWSEKEEIYEVLPRSNVLMNGKRRRLMSISQRNEAMGLTSLSSGFRTNKHCHEDNLHSSVQGGLRYFDGKRGIESAVKVAQIHKESTAIASSKMISLTNSVNPNSSMTRSGLLQFSLDCEQQVCGFEEQGLPTKLKFDNQQESICNNDGDSAMIRPNVHITRELCSEASPGNSFDPILIPGPPGSFLPSPGEMHSDEFQGNSSLTHSQVHSDEQDFTDGDSSDSQIFASSTFSNFTAGRSELNYFAPAQLNAYRTKSRAAFSDCNLKPSIENSGTESISCVRESLQVSHNSLKEKLSSCQQPQMFTHQSLPSFPIPCYSKQMGYNLNRSFHNLDSRPAIPPSCCCNRPEKVTAPTGKSPEDYFPFISSHKVGLKFSDCGNLASATSSSSNPVLRLMGKNLMINKNEDDSSKMEQTKPCNHMGQHYDVRLLNGFRTSMDFMTSRPFLQRQEVLHPNNQTDNGDCDKSRAREMGKYNTSELIAAPHSQKMNANFSAYPVEEILNLADMTAYDSNYSRGFAASRKLTPRI